MGLGDPLGKGEDEALVLVDLVRGRLGVQELDDLAEVLEAVLLELLEGVVAGSVDLGLGRGDLVQELALAMLGARLAV